jgi:hypothetical protein
VKDDILKRLVTWATGVNTLNGTYTLSKQQYQDLRAMQKDAMEALSSLHVFKDAAEAKRPTASVGRDRWNGYWPLDVVAVAARLFGGGYYNFAWAEGRLWDNYQERREWKILQPVDEEHMRLYGSLRHPDEPDYVKLG